MNQTNMLQIFLLAIIAISFLALMCPSYRNAFAEWIIFKKRANGVDVSSFEVECVGVKISNNSIPQREIAILKSAISCDLQMNSLFHWTETYKGGEK